MNIHEGLEDNLKYISTYNGVCLNIEERYKLEIALNNLHLDIKSDEMWFWGKITGVEKDYYVAVAIFFRENYMFPRKKFYFCNSSNFVFSELPELMSHHLKDADRFNTYFIGNPDIILESYNDTSEERVEDNEDEDVFKPRLVLKNFTESDRLSYVIRCIDIETAVIPEGSFKMLPINEVRRNDNFVGLSTSDITNQSKFLHFRLPQNKIQKDLIAMGQAVFNFNFLDPIDKDPIKNSWSVQCDSTRTVANIRSLIWPGYFAYHKANSKIFGGIYIGHGIKNIDFSFMQ